MLIVVGGLPGVGKTYLAKAAAKTLRAVYLRNRHDRTSLHELLSKLR